MTLTVSTSLPGDAFTEIEYYYLCTDSDGDEYESARIPKSFTSTNSIDITWPDVTTGTGTDECDRTWRSVVFYYVRIQSDSTHWSEWKDRYGAIVTPPTPPTRLKANGDSRGASGIGLPGTGTQTGKSVVQWRRVSHAASYDVEYRLYCGDAVCLNWMPRNVSGTSFTITDLVVDSLYSIRVRAVNVAGESDWSYIYTFPTIGPADLSTEIGPIPMFQIPATTHYSYIICEDTINLILPNLSNTPYNEQQPVIDEIVQGVGSWRTATGAVTATRNTVDTPCSDAYGSRTANTIEIVDHVEMPMRCATATGVATGCASVRGGRTRLSILDTRARTGVCPRFLSTVIHEVGHVYGLGDPPDDGGYMHPTVMDYDFYPDCEPTELDVAAIKAIFQSRS